MTTAICEAHQAIYSGTTCAFCALNARMHADRTLFDARLVDLSQGAADLRLECADLRRQINALLQVLIDLQRAHNAAAGLPYKECAGQPYRAPQ